MNGLAAILLKEFAHIRREPSTLFFALVVPVFQLALFGYAINTTIDNISTVGIPENTSKGRLFDARAYQELASLSRVDDLIARLTRSSTKASSPRT